MAFPFELYCKSCGSKILALVSRETSADLTRIFQQESSVDSWLSDQIREHPIICPGCGRKIKQDPLIRAEVMFSDWNDSSDEKSKSIMFYI